MIKRFVLYPYKVASESAHRLKDAFKEAGYSAIIVYPDREYQCKEGDLVIGWGNSHQPNWHNTIPKASGIVNLWPNIAASVNKEKAFSFFKEAGVSVPEATKSISKASRWLEKGHIVVGRELLTSMKGKGIDLFFPDKEYEDSDLQKCKLFTKFIPETKEFRVYVFGDKVIDVLEKRRVNGSNDPGYVRSEENGWVFCRQGVHIDNAIEKESIKATKALGLFFAGVDILITKHGNPYVLETNTCPDIFGTGVGIFRDAFINYAKGL